MPAADCLPEYSESAGGTSRLTPQGVGDSDRAGREPVAADPGTGDGESAAFSCWGRAGTGAGVGRSGVAGEGADRPAASFLNPIGRGRDSVRTGSNDVMRVDRRIGPGSFTGRPTDAEHIAGRIAFARGKQRQGSPAPRVADSGGGADDDSADVGRAATEELSAAARGEPGLRHAQRADHEAGIIRGALWNSHGTAGIF